MTTLAGASILVVGASGGLGSEISRLLSDAGARLILSARYASAIEALGIPGTVLTADLAKPAEIDDLVARAVAVNGRLDGVVIAAGIVAFGPATALSDATLEKLFVVNTFAPIRLVRAAHTALAASAAEGREPFVVTISGVVSESPTANLAAYSASKAGMHAFGQAAARELHRAGIRILDARPGQTETGLNEHAIAGSAPRRAVGYQRDVVAQRIVDALMNGELDLPSSAFTA
ncbi:MAG: SDR family NAD(P)-dependent oxidoreductase [Cryobacterium sp.]